MGGDTDPQAVHAVSLQPVRPEIRMGRWRREPAGLCHGASEWMLRKAPIGVHSLRRRPGVRGRRQGSRSLNLRFLSWPVELAGRQRALMARQQRPRCRTKSHLPTCARLLPEAPRPSTQLRLPRSELPTDSRTAGLAAMVDLASTLRDADGTTPKPLSARYHLFLRATEGAFPPACRLRAACASSPACHLPGL